MKILMISGDQNVLKPGTDAHERLMLQARAVEELDVFVWPKMHSLRQVFSAARKNRYDVITAQDPFFRGQLALHLRQLFGGRVNIQVHIDLRGQSYLRRLFARLQLLRADSIRVVSERVKKEAEEFGVKAPITILPVFIDIQKFRTVIPRPHEGKNILWVGRFEKEKDPFLAIEVFKSMRQAVPGAKLIMLGNGSLRGALEARRESDVEFPGWQDPLAYYEIADVVLSTSPHESFGASIVEALAAGVPVVSLDVGVAKEAGATVVPKDKLADALIDVLQNQAHGQLKLALLSKDAWVERWRASL